MVCACSRSEPFKFAILVTPLVALIGAQRAYVIEFATDYLGEEVNVYRRAFSNRVLLGSDRLYGSTGLAFSRFWGGLADCCPAHNGRLR